MKNIYLIGFMGAGKSTIARKMSKKYGREQMEMDEEIERTEGMSIPDIFEKKGESYFREKETQLLERCTGQSRLVVSCGGGAAMRECNITEMKKNGVIIYLAAEPETVYERVKNSHNRPLLEGNMNVAYIRKLMEQREAKYSAAADLIVNVDRRDPEAICDEIIAFDNTLKEKRNADE